MIDPKVRRVVTELSVLLANYNCARAVHEDLVKRRDNMKYSMHVFRDEAARIMTLDAQKQQAKYEHAERAFRRKLIQLRKLVEGSEQ